MGFVPLTYLAMALDTLPVAGRLMLLAALLSGALYGFVRVLPDEAGSGLNVLYRKGALGALLFVPLGVYLFGVQVPVRVDQMVRLDTQAPSYFVYVLGIVWALGACFHLVKLWRDLGATRRAAAAVEGAPLSMAGRVAHWQQRLNLKSEVRLCCGGAEQGWHVHPFAIGRPVSIVLPAASRNWPSGLLDVQVLVQLAQVNQRGWRWLVYGRVIQALYWPTPWVASLVRQLVRHLDIPAHKLAAAAYRDHDGWTRDARNLTKRGSTLQAIEEPCTGAWVRLANTGEVWVPPPRERGEVGPGEATFAHKWAVTLKRKRAKERDPYEQAYWLIAVACLVVGVATTLTVVEAPPEFEPRYLNIKWQDQMMRRMHDYYDQPAPAGNERTDN